MPTRHGSPAFSHVVERLAAAALDQQDSRAEGRAEDRSDDRADDTADDNINPAVQPEPEPDRAEQDDDAVLGGEEDEDVAAVLDSVALMTMRGKKSLAEDEEDDDEDEDDDGDVGYMDSAKARNLDPEQPLPFWHLPCGRSVNLVVRRPKGSRGRSARTVTRRINEALERVWRQLNMTVLHYRLQRFDKLYYRVVIGVNEDHYIPSWVPDREDLPKLTAEDFKSSHKLAHELTRMHSQLQKFSVALEHISEDNRLEDPLRHNALSKTKNYVKMLLCEVEWALLSLAIPLPLAVPREIMSPAEMNMTDDTNRDIRDWGVLVKYRDFLHGWSDILAQSGRARAQAEFTTAAQSDAGADRQRSDAARTLSAEKRGTAAAGRGKGRGSGRTKRQQRLRR